MNWASKATKIYERIKEQHIYPIHGGLLKPDVVEGTLMMKEFGVCLLWDLTETSKRDDGIDLLKDNQALQRLTGTAEKAAAEDSSRAAAAAKPGPTSATGKITESAAAAGRTAMAARGPSSGGWCMRRRPATAEQGASDLLDYDVTGSSGGGSTIWAAAATNNDNFAQRQQHRRSIWRIGVAPCSRSSRHLGTRRLAVADDKLSDDGGGGDDDGNGGGGGSSATVVAAALRRRCGGGDLGVWEQRNGFAGRRRRANGLVKLFRN
ncbi:hypothetical protein Syun_018861 [Stephania yunnanensis]|uniref:Uncharacterized protein n=1 Tax=Stephania yunnanensis TaxID=152371 RepID=A0AAP0IT13_9MAGN